MLYRWNNPARLWRFNMIRAIVLYTGTVQGVGFRATACSIARKFPVAGYVRNLPDGTVEPVAEGQNDAVERFLTTIADSFRGYITRDTRTRATPTGEFDRFEIRA